MNHWPFIIASYGLTLVGTSVLAFSSYAAMRRAEAEAEAVTRK